MLVRSGERFRALLRDKKEALPVRGSKHALAQRHAVHIFHNHEQLAGVFEQVINRGDIRGWQSRSALGLASQAAPVTLVSAIHSGNAFEGHATLQEGILGQVNFAHAAHADAALYCEAAGHGYTVERRMQSGLLRR